MIRRIAMIRAECHRRGDRMRDDFLLCANTFVWFALLVLLVGGLLS